MIETSLGPYQLREAIGKGGMATVYRAYQPAIDRDVAVKIIHSAILHDSSAIERFRREARLIARLEHPHILPIYDFDGAHAPPYIVMRYLESGTLRDLLARERLPLANVTELLAHIAGALDYAHAQGVVHRDVKPSNILLDRHGNALVSDFGIARIMAGQAPDEGPITTTGAIIGTPDYMAPEQASGHADVDGRADIYALGVMLFQIVTGRLPYVAAQPLGMLIQHQQAPIPSACALNPQLPPEIDTLFERALAKEPRERFATAGALAAEFGALFRQQHAVGAATQHLPGLTSVLSRRAAPTPTPSEQHKVVTALYADAAEYAELVEAQRGVESARRDLHALWEQVERIVNAQGGTLLTQTGHTLLALWGADAAGEDDAERAVRASLQIMSGMRTLDPTVVADGEAAPVAIGVNTGMA
ncbi:MAG TPA: protein kinase, partial [Roseiflexaceae bacterium]|nr:protein kinase [Roseiflexaceae bacterium]